MKHIGNLTPAEGSRKKRKRIGRGAGSGHGGTSTKGHKGHQSRSGFSQSRGFEGGQMPLHRRLPKFGFKNPFRVEYDVVNVSTLQRLVDENIITDGVVNREVLTSLNLISRSGSPFKILGNGVLNAKLQVSADSISASAKQKIESAGGTVVTNE